GGVEVGEFERPWRLADEIDKKALHDVHGVIVVSQDALGFANEGKPIALIGLRGVTHASRTAGARGTSDGHAMGFRAIRGARALLARGAVASITRADAHRGPAFAQAARAILPLQAEGAALVSL